MPESLWRATITITIIKHGRKFALNPKTFSFKHHEPTVVGIKQKFIDCIGSEDKFRVLNDPIRSFNLQPQASHLISSQLGLILIKKVAIRQ